MAEIVNLRQYRKARARAEKAALAAENRARSGRPKTTRGLAEARGAIESARLEGHRLDGPEPGVPDEAPRPASAPASARTLAPVPSPTPSRVPSPTPSPFPRPVPVPRRGAPSDEPGRE